MSNQNILNKGKIDMTNKLSYIKRLVNYIIGAVILTISLNTTAFGLNQDNDGYYQIGNKAELKEFADKVNNEGENDAKGKLINDIVFNEGVIENGELSQGKLFEKWNPIGAAANEYDNDHKFWGELISCDGTTKTITGLYINEENEDYQGLFGFLGDNSEVKNIKVDGSYIKGRNYVGGIAGYSQGGKIENCSTDNIIKGESAIGGNVGYADWGVLKQCENSGIVEGKDYVGGNVGVNRGEILGGLKNSAEVTGTEYSVGGNIGDNRSHWIEGKFENSGKVKGRDDIGGNIGYNRETIKKCENSGYIEGKDYVGGNIGRNGDNISYLAEIEGDCDNSGIVIGEECVGGNVGVNRGKILGRLKNSEEVTGIMAVGGNVGENLRAIGGMEWENGDLRDDNGELIIQGECENSGKVKGIDYVGGNIGHISNNGYLRHAKNSGKVEGNNNIGGNVGKNDGKILKYANITDYCLKNEWIVAGIKNVGGNIGFNNNEQIAGIFRNNGDIIGDEKVGQNIGCSTTKVSVDCYMEGTVNGNKVNYPLGE